MIDRDGQLKRIDMNGVIYFDSILGIDGTTYPIGTRELPSNTIADVITLCGLLNIRHINVRGVLVLAAAMSAYRFEGYKHLDIAHTVNLGGQDVSVSSFHRLIITGAQGGAGLASYDDCMLLSVTGFNGVATLCGLITAITLAAATSTAFINCFSYLGACTINLGTPTIANFENLTGSFILANQTAGITNIWAANGCEIIINNTCNGGTINIYGSGWVTDNSAGGCTVNNYTIQASGTVALTTFGTEAGGAVAYVAASWETIFTSAVTKPTKLVGIIITNSAAPTTPIYRICSPAGTKIFPFGASDAVASGILQLFDPLIEIPKGATYEVSVNCTAIGGTATLTELDKIELG